MDQFEYEKLIEEATYTTLERLHALVRKGYRPGFENGETGTLKQTCRQPLLNGSP